MEKHLNAYFRNMFNNEGAPLSSRPKTTDEPSAPFPLGSAPIDTTVLPAGARLKRSKISMKNVSVLADDVHADVICIPRHGRVLLLQRTGPEVGEELDVFPTDALVWQVVTQSRRENKCR